MSRWVGGCEMRDTFTVAEHQIDRCNWLLWAWQRNFLGKSQQWTNLLMMHIRCNTLWSKYTCLNECTRWIAYNGWISIILFDQHDYKTIFFQLRLVDFIFWSLSGPKRIWWRWHKRVHYDGVIMGALASQIINLTIVYSTVYSDADQRKHQSPASLAFVQGIHRGPVDSPHKWPVTRKMFPFHDVIMYLVMSIHDVHFQIVWPFQLHELRGSPWGPIY